MSGLHLLSASLLASSLAAAPLQVGALRCEYRDDPLGIDVAQPRLSWVLTGAEAGARQTAYQVQVASTREKLAAGQGDRWDSGRVESDQTNQIVYAGGALRSREDCFWRVRAWDQAGQATAWSVPARWSMGLLAPGDWQASWIGYDQATLPPAGKVVPRPNLGGLKWLRLPGKQTRRGSYAAWFRLAFEVPADRALSRAVLALSCDNECAVRCNGQPVGRACRWESTALLDVRAALKPGANVLALRATNSDFLPPFVIGRLTLEFETGAPTLIPLDKQRVKAAAEGLDGWDQPGFDDQAWAAPDEGGTPWGTGTLADIGTPPAPYLRRAFTLDKPVARATVHATALGLYELRLNGRPVQGKDVLTPGWTDYRKRVHYQTYDVSAALRPGANVLGAVLGDGWYSGCLAFTGRRAWYGAHPRLLCQLVVDHPDGTTTVVASDASWRASYGPIQRGDLLLGCIYDARRALPGWDAPGFDDRAWSPVHTTGSSAPAAGVADVTARLAALVKDDRLALDVTNESMGGDPIFGQVKSLRVTYRAGGQQAVKTAAENARLELAGPGLTIIKAEYGASGTPSAAPAQRLVQAASAEPVRRQEELPTVKLTEPKPGCWTFDLGQNMVGWVRLRVSGQPGQQLTVRHGEMLNPDGTVYSANLRSASSTDVYYLRGGGEEVLEPSFTFHGFRYVEVRGLTARPDPAMVTGIVVHSDLRRTGEFACSHPLLNQLFHNIIWGQKGNYLEVPTDCPQRDERAGWTGDTQFFMRTGAFNYDVAAFFTRWLVTMCQDSQHGDGSYAHVAPDLGLGAGSTAWGDAALLCTYQLWQIYGDTRALAQHWDAFERYMAWLGRKAKGGIASVGGFGDWLNLGGGALKEVIDTAYYAHLARLMAEMATALGKTADAQRYSQLRADIQAAFTQAFLAPDGTLKNSSQTGYALAFTMDLIPADRRQQATERFVREIERHRWHLATGFIGTPRLLPGLSAAGRDDVAYRVLLQEDYPSWLFQVKLGATTMWERWDGWTPDRGFQSIGMNSFNHYAFGAVGEYLYTAVAGIETDGPGFRRLLIRPRPGPGLTWAKATYDSINGPVRSAWRVDGGKLSLDVTLPPNTSAKVYVPAKDPASVQAPAGTRLLPAEGGCAVLAAPAGTWRFEAEL